MSLFSQDPADDKWKKKYLDLLDEQDKIEAEQQEKEQLLCKIITRLALLATGFSAELDPYLKQIRKQLNKGIVNTALKQQLQQFSDALLKLEDTPGKQDPELLFQFLKRQYPRQQARLEQIARDWQHHQYRTLQDMLLALHDAIDEEQAVVSDIPQQAIDRQQICRQLLKLLETTEIPETFSPQAEQLKMRLQDDEPLIDVLDETLNLLSAIKKSLLHEQQEMAEFLNQLTCQLNQLGVQAQGTSAAFAKQIKKRNLLDQSVSHQMQDLQQSSASATQLDGLKKLISHRLHAITQELQQHQQQEKKEQQQTQQHIEQLTAKIQHLEKESADIKFKLEQTRHQALKDPLTQLPNRLAYDERLETEIARFQRTGAPLSMLIWDIDFFKKINDTYGHKAGDKTLQIIARLLQSHCRKMDFVARFGGEEFVMLLPGTDLDAAQIIAEKLRKTIEAAGFNSGGDKIKITVSCGISQFSQQDSGETVFLRADKALYQAKENGRNQCIIQPPPA